MRRVGFIIDQIDLNGQNKELTDELVALSTKYGILTPYTSFLADERVQLHVTTNLGMARENLQELAKVDGAAGVSQRGAKQLYMRAEKGYAADHLAAAPPATAAYAPAGQAGMPPMAMAKSSMGGGMGGMGGGMGGPVGKSPAQRLSGRVGAMAEPQSSSQNVRQVGGKTFYRKANRWVDAEVKPEDDAKAKSVEQFSDEFFRIARTQSAEMNQYMAMDEPVTVNLGGQVYKFDPPKPSAEKR
jgi:Ca-activated chloride channel homolog